MASKLEPCTVGILLGSTQDCHKSTYSRKAGIHNLAALPPEALPLKAECDSNICFHHIMVYLRKYEFLQKRCCDPFDMHPKTARTKSLCSIDIPNADKLNKLVVKDVKPGQKLCPKCSSHLGSIDETSIEEDEEYKPEDELHDLAATFTSLGCTPVKSKFAQRDRAVYARRKAQEVQTAIADEISRRVDVDSNELQTCKKCADLDAIIDGIKEKCSSSNLETTLKLITLVPPSWRIEKTANEFGVSKFMVNKARRLKKAKGILPDISPIKARKLSEESKTEVIDFYNDDEVSRMCPGKKDFVSVKNSEGKLVHVQKRLLLANLPELYLHYKEKSGGEHLGFSKFCELRPRWCVTVGAKGMHSVCVCEYHQNVKLLLSSLPGPKLDHKSLMAKLVCNTSERNCMIHWCEKCPGSSNLREHLQSVFLERSIDEDDELTFKQWTHTDGTRIITRQELACDLLDESFRKLIL